MMGLRVPDIQRKIAFMQMHHFVLSIFITGLVPSGYDAWLFAKALAIRAGMSVSQLN